MARANLELPDGTKVTISGSPDEVASLLSRFSTNLSGSTGKRSYSGTGGRRKSVSAAKSHAAKTRPKRSGPTDYIRELIGDGFFRTKREIGTVKDKLEERGHIYPVTSISGPLFRLVRSKELRRIKEDGAWKYVNP